MKHQKGMKKAFSLAMSEVDHKATLWVRDISQVIISPLLKSFLGFDKLNFPPNRVVKLARVLFGKESMELLLGNVR
jgi:hypothetical protein